jgi:hypothetical protein
LITDCPRAISVLKETEPALYFPVVKRFLYVNPGFASLGNAAERDAKKWMLVFFAEISD